jgi:hypothetical protein
MVFEALPGFIWSILFLFGFVKESYTTVHFGLVLDDTQLFTK